MSSDLASVRAEVKAWERRFRETNGRNPTINDIKQQPTVAQKYKLYKKLSKATTTSSASTSEPNGPPSTPPRQTFSFFNPPQKLLLSASRRVETTAPLASYNPFSPQKRDKGKQRESITFNLPKPASNPFASPQKSKPQTSARQPSPDPFPPIQPTQSSASSRLSQEPPSAVSRARKRLRGEPVSPSPHKEKRRRVLSPTSLPFPRLQLKAPRNVSDDSTDDGEEDNVPDGGDSPFIDDSPMKPTANGKAFTFLFEEAVKSTSTSELFYGSALAARAQADGKWSKTKLSDTGEDIFSDDPRSKKTVKKPSLKAGPSVKSLSSVLTKSRSKLIQSTLPVASNLSNDARRQSPPQTRTSAKRVLSDIEHANDIAIDDARVIPPSEEPPTPALQLLPPSPNPNASHPSGKPKPNGARSSQPSKNTNRKKPKLHDDYDTMQDMDNDDGSSSDSLNTHHSVKLVHHSRGIRAALVTEENTSEIRDPILNCAKRVQPRGQGSASPVKQGDGNGTHVAVNKADDEDANVNADDEKLGLPSKLRRVLVLESLKSKQNEYEEERVVKGLLSGRRVLHYDPKKGGEIWGVGEDERDELARDELGGVDEGADEWEGDPVPWEVGELSESHYHLEES